MKHGDVKLYKNHKLTREDIIKMSEAFKKINDGLDEIKEIVPNNFSVKLLDYLLEVEQSLSTTAFCMDESLYDFYVKEDLMIDCDSQIIRYNKYKGG